LINLILNGKMKLTVLTENVAGKNCLAEYGLSYLIEADKRILFDVGSSNVFLENANRLGISLNTIDWVVLSHGHWDHGNGLKYFQEKPLLTHPAAFQKRFRKKDKGYIGLAFSKDELLVDYSITLSKTPYNISPEIIYLGEIPRKNNFESKDTLFITEDGKDDFVPDDSALVVRTSKGLVVVTGCAHAGICNTVEYACEVAGTNVVQAVFGGFHLRNDAAVTQKTIQYLKQKGVLHVYPTHCTSFPALVRFSQEFKIYQVLTGDYFYF
jgi:7,8-dihydropterin-6-yl-methyl-4-(beta-D-ribofuranosyl)aminobenzene 5'-phosphate synthase